MSETIEDERQTDVESIAGRGSLRPMAGDSANRLCSLVERIERLEEERKALGDDIKDIFTEAKSAGFDVKVLRQLLKT
jgi:hypothetical protein